MTTVVAAMACAASSHAPMTHATRCNIRLITSSFWSVIYARRIAAFPQRRGICHSGARRAMPILDRPKRSASCAGMPGEPDGEAGIMASTLDGASTKAQLGRSPFARMDTLARRRAPEATCLAPARGDLAGRRLRGAGGHGLAALRRLQARPRDHRR